MLVDPQPPRIQLPKGWQGCVKSAVLYAIALAQGLPRFSGTTRLYTHEPGQLTASMRGYDWRRKTIGSTKSVPCCAKNSASRIFGWRSSRLSAGRIMVRTSAWPFLSFVPREAGLSNKPPIPSSSRQLRLPRGSNASMKTDPMLCCSCASPSTSSPTSFAASYND